MLISSGIEEAGGLGVSEVRMGLPRMRGAVKRLKKSEVRLSIEELGQEPFPTGTVHCRCQK